MKKIILVLALLFLTFILFSQVQQYEVTVRNVEVPLRVMDGKRFVDNITIDDLELYEDGKLQKIEALYLVQRSDIERKETLKEFHPALSKHYYLLFQITDYNPKLGETIKYLFDHILLPEDALTIMTPMDTYRLSPKAFKTKPKETLAKEMIKIVRKDTKIGSSNYKSLLRNTKRLASAIQGAAGFGGGRTLDVSESGFESQSSEDAGSGLEFLLPRYRNALQEMEELRLIDEKKFITFAQALKRQRNQKNVYLFYQREFRPEIRPGILSQMMTLYQDRPNIQGDLMELFQFYQRRLSINIDRIKQAFADASILFNFMFIHKEADRVSGINMREQSEDIFNVFSQVAEATGGIVDNSQNPEYAFKNAVESFGTYYLLYYSPADYKRDGKYKQITIKLKNKDYKVTHRRGYYAN